jgi:hypothetical protein
LENGVPYAIDFMNPAPDAGLESVGPANFQWIVDAVAELAIDRAARHTGDSRATSWSNFLFSRQAASEAAG